MPTKRMLLTILAAGTVVLALVCGSQLAGGSVQARPPAQSPVPPGVTIPYPGRLTSEAGQPVADGTYDFTFTLYAAESGGEPLWMETQEGVAVQGGAFTAVLGRVAPLPQDVLAGGARLGTDRRTLWLEVGVRGPGETEFTLLSPRQELSAAASVAPADVSASSLSCVHTHWGEVWSGSQNGLVLQGNSDGYATLYARDISPSGGYGVYGLSDHGTGTYGQSAGTGGAGVYGYATSTTSNAKGVYGKSDSHIGTGVYGYNSSSGWGVSGDSVNGVGVSGDTVRSDHNYGLRTSDNLYSLNFHSLGATMHIVQNGGSEPLEAGDVVVFSGLAAPLEENGVPVIRVAKAASANSTGVAGVVFSRYNIEALTESEDTTSSANREITPAGPVPPGEYLLVVVQGPAQVKASALAGPIQPGDLLSSADQAGYAAKAAEASLGGVKMASPGTVLGKALEALGTGQDTGLLWIWVTLQ